MYFYAHFCTYRQFFVFNAVPTTSASWIIVFAVADEVDVVFATKKGSVKIDVVHDLVIVLIFEFRRDVGIADEVIYHCFEDDVEVAYDEEVLSVFVGAAVVFEECVK